MTWDGEGAGNMVKFLRRRVRREGIATIGCRGHVGQRGRVHETVSLKVGSWAKHFAQIFGRVHSKPSHVD